MPKLTPCLWFDGQAEQATDYYCSIFKNSKVKRVSHYTEAGPGPEGSVLTVEFELDGQPFMALNGGPEFRFSEAVSFVVECKNQKEVDEYWENLSTGGRQGQCGWLKDKYGLSWQIVPAIVQDMVASKDARKANRAIAAILTMRKIEIDELKKAVEAA